MLQKSRKHVTTRFSIHSQHTWLLSIYPLSLLQISKSLVYCFPPGKGLLSNYAFLQNDHYFVEIVKARRSTTDCSTQPEKWTADCSCVYTARNMNSWLQFYLQSQKHGQLTAVVCTQPDAWTADCSFIYKARNMVGWLQLCLHSQKHERLTAVLSTKPETW